MRFEVLRFTAFEPIEEVWYVGQHIKECPWAVGYLCKDGEIYSSTRGKAATHPKHLYEYSGFWETREEAEMFLKQWIDNLPDERLAEIIVGRMLE